METYEASVHSFIVKIWLEETVEEAGQATWRGHITHVPTGERRYLQSLDDVTAFISLYLEGMGVDLGLWWRLRRWMRRPRRFQGQRGQMGRQGGRGKPGVYRSEDKLQPGYSTESDDCE